jgi:hypothetical protein
VLSAAFRALGAYPAGDTVLYVSPAPILLPQGQEHERTTMENLALAEELAGSDELDELYKLEASESEPEEEDEEDGEEDGEVEHGAVEPENTPYE